MKKKCLIIIFLILFILLYVFTCTFQSLAFGIIQIDYFTETLEEKKCLDENCSFYYNVYIPDYIDDSILASIKNDLDKSDSLYAIEGGYCFPLDGDICDSTLVKALFKVNDSTLLLNKYNYSFIKENTTKMTSDTINLKDCQLAYEKVDSLELDKCIVVASKKNQTMEWNPSISSFTHKLFYETNELKEGFVLDKNKLMSPKFSFYRNGMIKKIGIKTTIDNNTLWYNNDSSGFEYEFDYYGYKTKETKYTLGEISYVKEFFKNGKTSFYRNNNESTRYHENGQIASGVNGEFSSEGDLLVSCESQFLFADLFYNIKQRIFYPNGVLKRETLYKGFRYKSPFIFSEELMKIYPLYINFYSKNGELVKKVTDVKNEIGITDDYNIGGEFYPGISWKKEFKMIKNNLITK